jgi:hypothetical protein
MDEGTGAIFAPTSKPHWPIRRVASKWGSPQARVPARLNTLLDMPCISYAAGRDSLPIRESHVTRTLAHVKCPFTVSSPRNSEVRVTDSLWRVLRLLLWRMQDVSEMFTSSHFIRQGRMSELTYRFPHVFCDWNFADRNSRCNALPR